MAQYVELFMRLRGIRVSSLALASVAALLGSVSIQGQISLLDDMGVRVELEAPAQRIVSLSPHVTENLFALGAGDRIVATVMFSDYPPEASEIPVVGSFSSVSYETLLTLDPDLVIVWASGNGEEVTARIRSLGLPVYQDEPRSLRDIASSLQRFGVLTGLEERGESLASDLLERLQALEGNYRDKQEVSVFYQIWNDPLTTLNGEHLVSDIIRMCGGKNVFAEAIPLVPVVSTESVLQADPQLIVASGENQQRPPWLDDWKRWSGMRAVQRDQLRFIPPDILQRNSPRVMQGAEMMCDYIDQTRALY